MTRAKLISTKTETTPFRPQFNEIVSPQIEPATESSTVAIDQLLTDLGCLGDRPTSNAKVRALLSSFLMQAQRLASRVERKGGQMIIGWPHDEAYWRIRSQVGYKVAAKLRRALIKHGWMQHEVDAEINLHDGDGSCHGYLIADFVPSKAQGISFQSNDSFIYATKSSALKTKVVHRDMDKRTKAIWALWRQAPLTYGDNQHQMWTAHRAFSDAELTKGGRFYGPWTSMRKAERLKCTIDGKPVAEVDVSGMFLTLLCSITGHVPFTTRFKDPYQLPYHFKDIDRSEVKAVINSAIGGGTSKQYQPTKMIKMANISQERLKEIRAAIIPAYECLQSLHKTEMYSETLAMHEVEIMMRLIEQLRKPIFILHDCLICQQDDALDVGKELQKQYVSYCSEKGWTPIEPAFSIDMDGKAARLVSGHVNL
tara:strand:- start:92 stop:1366 length:1275 start_codon:yes stop_codon:yes gene_type:complete